MQKLQPAKIKYVWPKIPILVFLMFILAFIVILTQL